MNLKNVCIGFVILSLLVSCNVKPFTSDDLKWFEPYYQKTAVIFESDNGELDTIIFHETLTSTYSARNIEQGFYDRITKSVAYEFTNGSYHQLAKMSGDIKRYNQDIFSISKTSLNEFTDREFIFIGIIFSGNEMAHIKQIDSFTYFFDRNKATYPEVNVEKGINNFTFDTRKGIVTYTDTRNVVWTRKHEIN